MFINTRHRRNSSLAIIELNTDPVASGQQIHQLEHLPLEFYQSETHLDHYSQEFYLLQT